MPFFLIIYFLVFLSLLNCSSPEEKITGFPQQKFLSELPEEESINASLYHYELILARVKKNFEQQKYYAVLEDYDFYLEVFDEFRITDESELNYYIGLTILELVATPEFFSFIKQKPKRMLYYNLKREKGKQKFAYDKTHFQKIISDRNDYFFEKQAIRELYLDELQLLNSVLEKNKKKIHDENFEYLNYLLTRFPDFIAYDKLILLLRDKWFLEYAYLASGQKMALENIKKILLTFNQKNYNTTFFQDNIYFPEQEEIFIRSRSHEISSRNLGRIELWQPFKIVYSLIGEDGHEWYWIEYQNNRYGFIRKKKKMKAYSKNLVSVKTYWDLYNLYNEKKYLQVIENLSEIMQKQELFLKERNLVFLKKTLDAIGERATSKGNIFTSFALEYPAYFVLYEKEWYLKSSDNVLFLLLETNPKTLMLQYFDGFDIDLESKINENEKISQS